MFFILCRNGCIRIAFPSLILKFILFMKLVLFIIFITCMQVSASALAQQITLSEQNVSLQKILREIRKQSDVDFIVKTAQLQQSNPVTINVTKQPLDKVLEQIFQGQPVDYLVDNKTIIVLDKKAIQPSSNLPGESVKQQRVSGKVITANSEPLAGVSITEKGTTNATLTNDDGQFSLQVASTPAVLVLTYIGYVSQEVTAGTNSPLEITMQQDLASLEEVVVVGYGTAQKKDLTGSVASLQPKDFNKGTVVSPDQLIQGRASGVMVINNTGQPGGSTTVRIRGNSSIRAGNNPLFVVDGIPLSGTSARPGDGGGGYGSDDGNPLSYLNPNDIASMDILKDASATAIYGSRGANGVIIITTKRGQSGTPTMNVMASTGFSNLLNRPQVLSAEQFRQALAFYTPDDEAADHGGSVNAFDAITRTAITQNYALDVSGGNESAKYRLSAGYLNQNGIIETDRLRKFTTNLSGNFKFLESKKLGLDINILAAQNSENIAPINVGVGFEGNIISQALQWNPTLPLHDNEGELAYQSPTLINPLTSLAAYKDRSTVNTLLTSISPSYKITDELEYRLMYSLTSQTGRRTGRYIAGMINPNNINNGSAYIHNNTEMNHQLTHTLSFNKEIATSLNLNAVVGYEYLSFDTRWNAESGSGFSNLGGLDYYDYLDYAIASNRSVDSYRSPTNELQSFFARVSLNFADRYLFTGTIRRDGSTKFGENNKYANFPSIAFAWNLYNESFLRDSEHISNLKLRLGWGMTGNQEFPSGASKDRFVFSAQSITQANFGNPDLRWESSSTINAGLDFGFFRNRLSGSIDYFRKTTTDALFEQTLAQPAPGGRLWVNLDGEIINEGVELALNGNIVQNDNWNWNIGANATFLKNNVNGLLGYYETAALRGQGFSGVLGQRMVSGQPLNVWYLAIFEGIDPETGTSMYRGLDGTIGTSVDPALNKFYVNSPNPDYLLGISTDVAYKRFTLTVNMHGAFGHYLFNNTMATVLGVNNLSNRNISEEVFDTQAGESTSNSAAPSTRYLEKGDFLKLSNASLSYNIGNIGKAIRNLNISITGQNLLVFTGYTGFDPEVNTDGTQDGIPSLGIEYLPYPPARTFLLGLNFSL
ncbi:SusC/RagA family TonB-linked outer membrane protein [Parapedobacter indicus]|uniref:Iron complex outermembrane recepter protein n=2 Tax=Parapedobacter indicus TaxID=1477437 RepID=A0A1I3F4H0_9SPHI|nr:SusC/RagA family TonB-linked outer membrane protein [Parapedobacter indicus]PPL03558.1 iron complex outermembrane receptor protein [Parapedobacter indicus]SFI06063.1 iron complex outermembrane recepter protein [Parapedobacter indicus]